MESLVPSLALVAGGNNKHFYLSEDTCDSRAATPSHQGKQFNPGGVAHRVSSKVATAKDIYGDIKEWEIGLRFLCSLCLRMSKGVCVVV